MVDEGQDSPSSRVIDLRRANREVGLSEQQLWSRYFALGGMAMPYELEAYMEGILPLASHEHDVLVHALNERSMELGSPRRWPYAEET